MPNKKKKKKVKAAAEASRGIVGPDFMQLLIGRLLGKDVAIVLCGESHEDALDVTRQGGKFMGKEGWVQTSLGDLAAEMWSRQCSTAVRYGALKRKEKSISLGKSREWATTYVQDEMDYVDHGSEIVFLWAPSTESGGSKGRAYVLELFLDDEEQDGDRRQEKSSSTIPQDVANLMLGITEACERFHSETTSLVDAVKDLSNNTVDKGAVLFQWADLDSEARMLNHRRLLGEDISLCDYDSLIEKRKATRKKEDNIFTFDDWFLEVRSKCNAKDGHADRPGIHLVLEASIPPWEVDLCRRSEEDGSEIVLRPADDAIRCLSEDSAGSELDEHDPSADGIGSYIDFVYRKFVAMEEQMHGSPAGKKSHWLHCIDSRDLGCEHGCVADSLHEQWMGLLRPEERKILSGQRPPDSAPANVHAHWKDGRCLLDWENNPEHIEINSLRERGILREEEGVDEDVHEETNLITFPSFEGFFGQNTDILYYAQNVKVAYAPFIGQCVGSFENWESFFTNLFFGGTIADALSSLDLSECKRQYLHVRSPILKAWDPATGEYQWHRRNDDEHEVTFPILPVHAFLKAAGSNPPRTWSSQLFAELVQDGRKDCSDIAHAARRWALDAIKKYAEDPKGSDDEHGGGEWFLSFLRATQRDIYNDIDRTDPSALLHKKYMPGESCGKQRKHKIGDISIPSCKQGFQGILDDISSFEERRTEQPHTRLMSPLSEISAKLLIDIFMGGLVDFSAVLKIAQLVANEPSSRSRVVIVCYMGSVHARAVANFYSDKLAFRKKVFAGKNEWDDDAARVLHFPTELWNLDTGLF